MGGMEGGRGGQATGNCLNTSSLSLSCSHTQIDTHTGHSWAGGNGNTFANTAASHTDVHTGTTTHTLFIHLSLSLFLLVCHRERQTGPWLSQDLCVSPLQLPITSKTKPSVPDPEPIRSENEAYQPIEEAVRFDSWCPITKTSGNSRP